MVAGPTSSAGAASCTCAFSQNLLTVSALLAFFSTFLVGAFSEVRQRCIKK
jgi:hypothetical protein